jgi:hypothetical protein
VALQEFADKSQLRRGKRSFRILAIHPLPPRDGWDYFWVINHKQFHVLTMKVRY